MTQLLQELLALPDSSFDDELAYLIEGLGGLTMVDAKLRKALMMTNYVKRSSRGGVVGNDLQSLRYTLGAGSKVTSKVLPNTAKVFDELNMSNHVGVVMAIDDKQILIAAKADNKESLMVIATPDFFTYVDKDTYNATIGKVKHYTERGVSQKTVDIDSDYRADRIVDYKAAAKVSVVKKLLKLIFDAAKEKKLDVKTFTITVDQDRIAKAAERMKGRAGVEPYKTGNEVSGHGYENRRHKTGYITPSSWITAAKKEAESKIAAKLAAYKTTKADEAKSDDELMDVLKAKSYPDLIKVGGFTYKLKSADVYMDNLLKAVKGQKSHWDNESKITYVLDGSSPEYKSTQNALRKLRDEHAEPGKSWKDVESDAVREYGKDLPASTFKVLLGMERGAIVPTDIKFESDPFNQIMF